MKKQLILIAYVLLIWTQATYGASIINNAAPSGAAGGDLTGTFPSPTIKTSVSLTTPILGVASATSLNKVTLTAPATGSTLTIADGKTLTVSNILTFTGTDSSSVALGAGGTVAYTANKLSAFAATTSAELASVLSDETGSGGGFVRATSPTFGTSILVGALQINDTGSSNYQILGSNTLALDTAIVLVRSVGGTTYTRFGSGGGMAVGNAYAAINAGDGKLLVSNSVGIGLTGSSRPFEISSASATMGMTSTTGTNATYGAFTNTSGNFFFGINGSANVFGTGFLPYAAVLYHDGGQAFQLGTSNAPRLTILSDGSTGVGQVAPPSGSLFDVGSGGYLQAEKVFAGAPTAGDCDAAGEIGRYVLDTTNTRVYVCFGVAGWKLLQAV